MSAQAADGAPPPGRDAGPDPDRRVADLARSVHELTRLLRDTSDRLQAVESELHRLRERGRGEPDGDGAGPRFAAVYADFADRFRGSPAEVSAKLAGYLPDVERLAGGGGVLDLGCGRGEWLELLRAAGVPARGVDASATFVASGRARGLAMEVGDALAHLRSLPPDSVDVVTAFHLAEHLPTEALLALMEAAREALRPGGCLLLETPNPTNLVMAACDFHNDPTHRVPLPPALTEFLMSAQGFVDVEVRPRNPATPPPALTGGADGCAGLRDLVTQRLFGPQDYAVLGYKAVLGYEVRGGEPAAGAR
ncbi:bifunctional 2-polyprenyl-6-hydroxyphenol methylase/3-demethylubiquinol 3-O-methyltransferase UbiG [Geodermatophilus sp. TF02-6]|uniref:class I SAM-dependent methyltransferase n=1 Tax=Geodermatophilus sp. TF02-6 TaxID=2250575 RepID=UPI0013143416|nr:class I SAM-dependent methyltransferase [Geodermatophilus sp. TF02-6]